MKLDYNILWIDNDLQNYIDNGSVRDVEDFLMEKGFEPNIEKVFDEANLDQSINKYDYDLIISDYNLENTTGDLVIKDIRENKRLDTEILFYTAKSSYRNDPQVIERLAFIERLTFWVGRDGLLDKIERVIGLSLKKLLELNATRGLITAATSHLDVEIEEIYYSLIDKPISEEAKPKIEKIFRTDYKEIKKSLIKRCKAQRDSHSVDFKLYFSQSDAFRKWNILKEIISLNVPDGFSLQLFKKYYEEVIDIRNKFAHAKAVEIEGKLVLKGQIEGKDFEFNEDSCIKIRQNLINHKRNIEALKQVIIN
jgi:CheY-like chemotaxis protein